ncbi:MAG: YkgJ family cysteine cluster protein [Pseudomonadota bacterium]
MNRAARRARTQKPGRGLDGLRKAVAAAKVPGAANEATDRARRIVLAYLDAAVRQGSGPDTLVSNMKSGVPAVTAARVALSQPQEEAGYACAHGCAFCCILTGDDGGTITESEARTLHAALSPLAGQPDGRNWHPRACPALDPETRACRAYEARPTICRSYVSYSAVACEQISQGIPAEGSGVLGAHATSLQVHSLCRAALKGTAAVATYALAEIAAAAVDGVAVDQALKRARHRPRELADELKRVTAGAARGKRTP